MQQKFFVLLGIIINVCPLASYTQKFNNIMQSKNFFNFKEDPNDKVGSSVNLGINMALKECKNVFKWEQWNCPDSAFLKKHSAPTKEKAYVDAIIAAGIVHAVTKNCSRGDLPNCNCNYAYKQTVQEHQGRNLTDLISKKVNSPPTKDWIWGGCTDDTSYGENIVLKYFEGHEKNVDPQGFSVRHNIKIGREIARKSMVKKCRCHGISGSCSLQTCWLEIPPLASLAQQLRQSYEKATKISFEPEAGALVVGNSISHSPLDNLGNGLVYLEKSPNFCDVNNTTGWPGMKGRLCSQTNAENSANYEKRSCRKLCRVCGHTISSSTRTVVFKCNCTFIWCCEVKCNTCVKTVIDYFCE